MYELGEIYYEGKYGEKANMDTSIAWYKKIPDRDYRFTESRLKKAENSKKTLIDLNARVQKGDADAAYELAYAWKSGDYGLVQDREKWRYYLKIAADGGNGNAITTLIDDYKNADPLSPEDKKRLLSLYDKLLEPVITAICATWVHSTWKAADWSVRIVRKPVNTLPKPVITLTMS